MSISPFDLGVFGAAESLVFHAQVLRVEIHRLLDVLDREDDVV